MKILLLKNTVGDKRSLIAGTVEDISEKDAAFLINARKAEPFIEAAPVEVSEPENTASQIPVKPKKKGK